MTALLHSSLFAADGRVMGQVTDPQGKAVASASLRLRSGADAAERHVSAGADGRFVFNALAPGSYTLGASARDFEPVTRTFPLAAGESLTVNLKFVRMAGRHDAITVTADVSQVDILTPDPAEKVFSSEDLLDANPGRPGAPVSIPGYPIETASSGIKAPQYFAPGVAGDHGEPIAQYIQVGTYLLPNNLSANAHGNGYADPNIYIANVIESVQVDGGAYNVREGNHALNLASIYGLRSHLDPFFTLTGDDRDITGTAGMSPSNTSWIAMEGSYGNGFLDRLEHRKQVKINGGQVLQLGNHTLTLFGIGYYGFSYVAGLSPIYGFNSVDAADGWKGYPDTIDPRQKDQTHTALMALNDVWKLGDDQEMQLSGFFRTYNLSLYSDFGEGLIRQSEFRTVAGGSAAYRKKFSKNFTLLAGTDYQREAPRRDDLDHYNFYNPADPYYYGPLVKVDGNNVTIAPVTPYIAGEGELSKYVHYYMGWRRDEISIDNQDLVTPANSWNRWVGVNSPKATVTLFPEESWYVPQVALSFGKSFFTEDPRMGSAEGQRTASGSPAAVDPVETARSYQLVASKRFHNTDLKLTLGHETQSAEYGKIDPDTGLQFDLGPGRIRYMAVMLRQGFRGGSLQATFEQADARDLDTGQVTPEAPRSIGDVSATYQKLPFHLQAKGEFEYVGRKVVGNGCDESSPSDLTSYCLGMPDKEFRLAVVRPFLEGKINVGANLMIASGFTGQTTENFATNYAPGQVGLVNGAVPANPVAEVVGVRIPSYASLSLTYRFGRKVSR
ncbi:MAG: TonB-dependent receptor [Bryobacteraceae bacterium]